MRSFLLVLAALPLASFGFAVNRFDYEVDNYDDYNDENGTTSNVYWLQDRYEGDAFFEYAVRPIFLPPRSELSVANGISSPVPTRPTETWLIRRGKTLRIWRMWTRMALLS